MFRAEPVRQVRLPGAGKIREAGMMARHGVRQDQTFIGNRLYRVPRAGRRMIDALRPIAMLFFEVRFTAFQAVQSRLEFRRVFSQVVPQPGRPILWLGAELVCELRRQLGDVLQVNFQRLRCFGAVGGGMLANCHTRFSCYFSAAQNSQR